MPPPWFLLASALVVLALCLYLLLQARAMRTGAPWMGTPGRSVAAMVSLARPRPGEVWADLGSGDGRTLLAAARAGCRAHGYELNGLLAAWSERRARQAGLAGLCTIHRQDFWTADLSDADIVSVYLIPHRMGDLREKLARELRPGARVVSFRFPVPDWSPAGEDAGVYLYTAPGAAGA